ncbi:dynein light chain Tctex-type 5-like [Amphiura filiformis]|uniref:dynein light chain Tctex-type 5-like n=1 Tax=Amphiura filiformis TaxID=82378 RepID=UPI003B217713
MQKTAHMTSNAKKQDGAASGPAAAGGSLFDLRPHPRELGKSYISLACAPSMDEDLEHFTHQAQVEYENTYRMEPPKRFVAERVQPVIIQLLESHLANVTYDPLECGMLSKTIAQEMKVKVKEMEFDRFKFVCIVNIGEKQEQDVRVGSRCLWDSNRDSFASAFYENQYLFASATVYAIYFE